MAGYTWEDVGTQRLPIPQFVQFVMHSPPGTAVYFEINQGWDLNTYMSADVFDAVNFLVWLNSADAHEKVPKHKPKPRPRPASKAVEGKQKPKEQRLMTMAEYAEKAGIKINWED